MAVSCSHYSLLLVQGICVGSGKVSLMSCSKLFHGIIHCLCVCVCNIEICISFAYFRDQYNTKHTIVPKQLDHLALYTHKHQKTKICNINLALLLLLDKVLVGYFTWARSVSYLVNGPRVLYSHCKFQSGILGKNPFWGRLSRHANLEVILRCWIVACVLLEVLPDLVI